MKVTPAMAILIIALTLPYLGNAVEGGGGLGSFLARHLPTISSVETLIVA